MSAGYTLETDASLRLGNPILRSAANYVHRGAHDANLAAMSRGYALQADVSLRALNTFGVEGRAACLVTVQDAEALPAALAETRIKDLPLICIGDGSNVLFVGDFPGVVLRQAVGWHRSAWG